MAGNQIITGLDIGTTKICVIVGEVKDPSRNKINIIGKGVSPSTGLKKGVIVDLEETASTIQKAIKTTEAAVGFKLEKAYVGLTGDHVKSFNRRIKTELSGKEITASDIENVLKMAQEETVKDAEILHVIPRQFIIDGRIKTKNPINMSGSTLEVETHIITCGASFASNIKKCMSRVGLAMAGGKPILEPLASSEAVLTPTEKDLGVAMVDIGGGTMDLAVFAGGEVCHTAVIPVGGNHITFDIAVGLKISLAEAERIKVKYGTLLEDVPEEKIFVKSIYEKETMVVSREKLCQIIQMRAEEMLWLVQRELLRFYQEKKIPLAGLTFTGGGAQLAGIISKAKEYFNLSIRIGNPENITGMMEVITNPAFATGVGLVIFGSKLEREALCRKTKGKMPESSSLVWKKVGNFWTGVKSWLTDLVNEWK